MGNKHRIRLIALVFLTAATIFTMTAIKGHAESYPDISGLSIFYVLPDNRQFYPCPGGYALVSTNSTSKTYITMLKPDGSPSVSEAASVSFVYQNAVVCGNYLYLSGKTSSSPDIVTICRFNLTDRSKLTNKIVSVTCDFTRGIKADSNGNVCLVTVPYNNTPTADAPFYSYAFIAQNGAVCTGVPVTENPTQESSALTSSASESSSSACENSSSACESSSAPQSETPDAIPYVFPEPVTVENLQNQLDAQGLGEKVRVTAASKSEVTSGNIATGCTVEVLLNGQVKSRVTAIIPGDLTGTGKATNQDCSLLYKQVTNQSQLSELAKKAADLNGDGVIDTSDLLQIKSRIG